MARIERIFEEKNGWSKWISPTLSMARPYHLSCCDCGLVHDLQFRVLKVTWRGKGGAWMGERKAGMKIHFRARRNKRATAQVRRKPNAKSGRAALAPSLPTKGEK
jgi:hypothetical protein